MYIYFRTAFKFKTHLNWTEGVETSVRVRAVFSCLVSQILGTLATLRPCGVHYTSIGQRASTVATYWSVRTSTTKYTRSRRARGRRRR